jgi:hypothetical protein
LILCVPPQAKGFPEEKNSTQHTRSSSPDDLENAKARSTSAAAIALRETMQVLQNPRSRRGRSAEATGPSGLPFQSWRKFTQYGAHCRREPRIHQDDAMTVRVDRGGIEFLRSA